MISYSFCSTETEAVVFLFWMLCYFCNSHICPASLKVHFFFSLPHVFHMIMQIKPQSGTWHVPTISSVVNRETFLPSSWDTRRYRWEGAALWVARPLRQFPHSQDAVHWEGRGFLCVTRAGWPLCAPLVPLHLFSVLAYDDWSIQISVSLTACMGFIWIFG